jgi:peptide deformylase
LTAGRIEKVSDLQVVFVPDSRLKKKSVDVKEDEFGEDLQKHMENMVAKMYELGGVGLAGVQVGDLRNIIVFNSDRSNPPGYMVNPKLVAYSEEMFDMTEGCLSYPGLEVDLSRPETVEIEYFTPLGEKATETFNGVNSVIIQHEMDHLRGKSILDFLSRLKKDVYLRKIKKVKRKVKAMLKQQKQVYY